MYSASLITFFAIVIVIFTFFLKVGLLLYIVCLIIIVAFIIHELYLIWYLLIRI